MQNHQRINQTSGDVEYFTPMPIVDAARRVMGSIDLDPASSLRANERIRAGSIFTKEQDGLTREWCGNCWVNHPFGRVANPIWISKIVQQYKSTRTILKVHAITCITFAATSEEWFQPLAVYPQCFLSPRTNFYLPDGTLKRGVSKGSVVTYMGPDLDKFALEFASMGTIKVKYAG